MEKEMLAIYKPGNYRKGVYLNYDSGELKLSVDGEYTWPDEEEFADKPEINGRVAKFLEDKLTWTEIKYIQREVKKLYITL